MSSDARLHTRTRWWNQEDWLAVVAGTIVIGAVLLGWRPAMPPLKWGGATALSSLFSAPALISALTLCAAYALISLPGALALGARAARYLGGFVFVFALAWLAQILAGNASASYWGIEYVIFALIIGLVISNTIGTPGWVLEAARTEYFIKTGLVVMGATIVFQEVLAAGALGMLQAVLVVIVVWYASFWIAKRAKLDDEFAAILASAVSICGVSAAIAACGAIQGDRRKLSYIASLVLIVAVPMIVLQPWIIRATAMPDAVAGAWLGGTLDTTGSVIAASELVSATATKIGTIVKFSQNVLIGVAAFLLSVWWTMRKPAAGQAKPSIAVIWERFPKFVIGFVAASLVFSFLIEPGLVKETRGLLSGLRTWWFALAFASIGLETRFRDLWGMESGRPAVAFVAAQGINLIWTLILAYLIFGGVIFPVPVL